MIYCLPFQLRPAIGNQTLIRDPNGYETRFTYDEKGNMLTRTLPLGFGLDGIEGTQDDATALKPDGSLDYTERFKYDSLGRTTLHVSFEGVITKFNYDNYGRLATKLFYENQTTFLAETPSETWTYQYDAWGRTIKVTQQKTGKSPLITTTLYNGEGRVASITTPQGTISYEYDDFGRQTQVALDTGETTSYTYDRLGRLASVSIDGSTTSYEYDALGNLAKTVTSNGLTTTYQYDNMNRLIKLLNFVDTNNDGIWNNGEDRVSQFDYTLDNLGRKVKAEEWFGNGNSQKSEIDWTYDDAGRLVQEVFDHYDDAFDQTQEWVYDLVGNRLKQRLDKGNDSVWDSVTSYDYDANDRLLEEIFNDKTTANKDRTTVYEYDYTQQTGKIVKENNVPVSETTFEYDVQGRMAAVTTVAGNRTEIVKYEYGADGIRTSALHEIYEAGVLVSKKRTEYLNDSRSLTGYSQVIKQTDYDENDEVQQIITQFIGHQRIAQIVTDSQGVETEYYYTFDGHGSTRVLTDFAGAVAELYSFDAYGNALGFNPATAKTEFLYSGEQFDAKIGQQYLRARYYDPSTGRFNRLDPFFGNLNDPQSLHKYLYCHADPVNGIDPSGESLGSFALGFAVFTLNVSRLTTASLLSMSLLYNIVNLYDKHVATGFGGRDATEKLTKLRNDVISGWKAIGINLPPDDAKKMKEEIIKRTHRASGSDTTHGWDIDQMVFSQKASWTDGLPGDILAGTLTYNSFVYPVAEVNYVLWGLINRLAHDDGILPGKTNLASITVLSTIYRAVAGGAIAASDLTLKGQYLRFETIQGKNAWVNYGWEWAKNDNPNDPICQSIIFGLPTYTQWTSNLTFYAGGFSS